MQTLRRKNPRHQGDIGEAAAIEWLVRNDYGIWLPFGHSPDVDLIAQRGVELIRIQVKTCTHQERGRSVVQLSTSGGNQSWDGTVRRFAAARCDYLFVLTADERKWFIPSQAVEGTTAICLGGPKYAEFEVAREDSPGGARPPLQSALPLGGAPETGEPGWTVNPVAMPERVRLPPPPLGRPEAHGPAPVLQGQHADRRRTRISSKHQITIPSTPFRAAELRVGDRLHAEADGAGRVVLTRIEKLIELQSMLTEKAVDRLA
jgi:hypothetical protein